MSEGDLIVKDYQVECRDLLMGPDTPYKIENLEALFDLNVRESDAANPGGDGDIPGRAFMASRRPILKVSVRPTVTKTLWAAMDDIEAIWDPGLATDVALVWQLNSEKRLYFGRPRRHSLPLAQLKHGVSKGAFEFYVPYPLKFGQTLKSITINQPEISTGLDPSHGTPIAFGPSTGGTGVADNAGGADSPPIIRFRGPSDASAFTLHNHTIGEFFTISGLTLASGDDLVVDPRHQDILLNGTANRFDKMTAGSIERWFLRPGSNQIEWVTDTTLAGATMVIEWRNAWR